MRSRRDEEQLRALIRETLQQEGLLDDLKAGAGKAYDYVTSLFGGEADSAQTDSPGKPKASSPTAASSGDESFLDRAITGLKQAFNSLLTGVMLEPGEINALVIGDSQAGSKLGAALAQALEGQGVKTKIVSETGASGREVADRLQSEAEGFDLVIAIFGGNDDSPGEAESAASEMYEICKESGSYLIIVGPPPATRITNLPLARQVFGNRIKDESSHLSHLGGDYAETRLEISQALQRFAAGREGVSSYGIAASIPDYPDQPDGIHCVEGSEEIARTVLDAVRIDKIIESISEKRREAIEAGYTPATPVSFLLGGSSPVVDLVRQKSRIPLNSDQLEMMEVIENVLQAEGFTQPAIVAAFANALEESALDPNASGDNGHSIGLFQLHDSGVGKGMSVAERRDPIINTRKIAESAKESRFMQYMRETNDPQILAAAFSKYVERPRDQAGNMASRAGTVRKLLGLEDVESPGVMSV